MNVLRSFLIALTALVCWYLVVASSPAIHRAIFRIVPPDGPLTTEQRTTIDSAVTTFIRYWGPADDLADYPELSRVEQSHLDDVMALNGIILLYLLPALLIGLFVLRFRFLQPLALIWSLEFIGFIGLLSLFMFQSVFIGMHELLFSQGNWILPSDQFVLTQVYPEAFFAWSWALILSFSLLSISMVHLMLRGRKAVQ